MIQAQTLKTPYLIVYIWVDLLELPHALGVDVQNLDSTFLVGKTDFHLHFQSTWTQQSLVNHIPSVGHTNHQDVVQLFNTVDLGQQLVHHSIMHTAIATDTSSSLTNGIDFVEDDDMQSTVGAKLE